MLHAHRLIDASRRRLLVAGAAMGPCWCCQQVLAGSEEEEGPGSPAWGYQRLSDWPRTCRMSSLQSPIDIPARSHSRPADASSITNVSFDYRDDAGPVTVVNPGHGTMQVCLPLLAASLMASPGLDRQVPRLLALAPQRGLLASPNDNLQAWIL